MIKRVWRPGAMGTGKSLLGDAAVGALETRIAALVELAGMRDRLSAEETASMDRLILDVGRELLLFKPGTADEAKKFLSGLPGLVPYDVWGRLNDWVESTMGRGR